MNNLQDKIFAMNEKPQDGDKVFLSSVLLMPANIIKRGIFTRLTCSKIFFAVDRTFGICTIFDKEPSFSAPSEIFAAAEHLPSKISDFQAKSIAEESFLRTATSGWQRIMSNENIIFQEGLFTQASLVYILRGETLINTYTGETADAGQIFRIIFAHDRPTNQ